MKVLVRLFSLLRPYWKTLIVSGVLLLGRAMAQLVPPLFQREIVDGVIGGKDLARLGGLIAALVGVYALIQLIAVGDNFLRHALGERFILDLRVKIYAYLQRLSLSFFERTSTGELMSRVTNDVAALEQFVTHGSALSAVDVIRLTGAIVVLLVLNWKLALLVIIPVPALVILLRYFNTHVRPIYRKVRDRLGDINAQLQDNLAGMRVIQAFGAEEQALEKFATESAGYYRARVQGIRYWSTFFPAMSFVASMGTVIVLAAGAVMVVRGEMSLGTLVAFLSYMVSFYEPIDRLTEVDNIFQQAIAAGSRVFEVMDASSEIQDEPDAQPLPALRGEVEFDDVHFRYNASDAAAEREPPEVLQDVTFRMAPGEVVALVGRSGAGKTSIANLLCRFYDPTHGRVRVDGFDLRQAQLSTLRNQVAVVLQDTFLFNASVRENLLLGKPGATEEELVAAAEAAYAHEFVMELPEGYDTDVGERGVKLSGGQKQRLALARAILADPRILILDEATSSVDAEAEYLIQQALESVLRNRTALVIAHRLSTVRSADKIIALENGRIVEMGSHAQLMQKGGLYSHLYRRQLELAVTDGDAEAM
ncbi:MAG TPA: ABC transporter ATP-binding protein [Anaerolineae bacterium]|nr:ABC transporter ATP-binding protein [Anaerolineae bacterium]